MMVSVPSFSADYQKGLDAYNRGDYQAALRDWRPLAEKGNAIAQYTLGLMYREGHGVVQSDTEAMKWFRKAAKQGNESAQNRLKRMEEYDPSTFANCIVCSLATKDNEWKLADPI